MANRPAPESKILADLTEIRGTYRKRVLGSGHVTAEDRRELRTLDNLLDFVELTKARGELGSAIVKGVETLSYLNSLAKPLGLKLIYLEDERNARKLVPFPSRDEYA